MAKIREGRGPARGVLHAPDCEEAPEGTPLLDVQRALDVAENRGTQLAPHRHPQHSGSPLRQPTVTGSAAAYPSRAYVAPLASTNRPGPATAVRPQYNIWRFIGTH
ncbi:hypothetical protein [Streptomyces sp. NPDC055992]|uniref:hypothetical protein n=1 Tax=Streptomyces sp. NPDC055992 TaxID=3345673 RepID=UPI0035DDEBA3